ncbi:hypothetical protein DFH09DRAFT_1088513 [Mycena vulgaris]|nr:hypothetical protein DFH09DRAFT_1088513 [Mycena vulgaris]
MQFSLIALFTLVAASVSAAPAPLRARTCDIKMPIQPAACVLDLGPSVVGCAAAAAQLGADPISDAGCILAAIKDVAELPPSCNGCGGGLASDFEDAKNAIEGLF